MQTPALVSPAPARCGRTSESVRHPAAQAACGPRHADAPAMGAPAPGPFAGRPWRAGEMGSTGSCRWHMMEHEDDMEVVDAELVDDGHLPATIHPRLMSAQVVDRHTILHPGQGLPTESDQPRYTERDLYVSEQTTERLGNQSAPRNAGANYLSQPTSSLPGAPTQALWPGRAPPPPTSSTSPTSSSRGAPRTPSTPPCPPSAPGFPRI